VAGDITEILIARANTVLVTKSGNDTTAAIGGRPFKTINGAIAAINQSGATGVTILVYPGIYDEKVVMPTGNSLRGISQETVIIRQQNVNSNTTLLTMANNTRVEDVNLQLTSSTHVNLVGVAFPGISTQTARLIMSSVTMDNSTATITGTSNVYGIHSFGTGSSDTSIDNLRASVVKIRSAGLGRKRAILVDTNAHTFRSRDNNILVTNTGGAGSYIGAEVNQSGAQLSIRASSIDGATADISQTNGSLIVGTTDLKNSTANSKGFITLLQRPMIIWADPGGLPSGTVRFYRPGTASVTNTQTFIRLNQKSLIKSLSIRALTGPGGTRTDTWTIQKNGIDTPLTVSLTGSQVSNINDSISVSFQPGDTITLKVTTSSTTSTTDSIVQVDVF
jgi:hypothetical protein